jgi:hypothetical protein
MISQSVAGDDRTHVEYVPTQVFTEFLRDYLFDGTAIDGIRYRSATGLVGANVVLFATAVNVGESGSTVRGEWIHLKSAQNRKFKA